LALLTGCGHPIPAAPNDSLSHKKSVLVLTSGSLDHTLQTNLVQTFNTWKQSEMITSEWIKAIDVVDELLVNKINKTPYAYILVLGNKLSTTALAAAVQTPEKRWIVLSDMSPPQLNAPAVPDNVALYQFNNANLAAQQEEWLNRQKILGTDGLNNSVGAATYQVLNGITVPSIDVNGAPNVVWNWNAIMEEQRKNIQSDLFEKGIHYYNSAQIMIIHQ
jgi:hypothetical protein